MVQKIIPHLWFDYKAEEAAEFYVSLFRNSLIKTIARYSEAGAKAAGMPLGAVMTIEFELAGKKFVGLNGGPFFSFSPAISFFVGCDTIEEVERLYEKLSGQGSVLMPLDSYPFSERFAWVNDRYGVSWQLYKGEYGQKITPCLMFVKNQYGKASDAMQFYTSLFKNSSIDLSVPYTKEEGEKEGAIKHGKFTLDGEQFIAMDSGHDHQFTFTPAVSFLVECEDQGEIDHFWNNLSAVPEAEQCGWLMDKYGISWQVVPSILD